MVSQEKPDPVEDDRELVARARAGETRAFDELVFRHQAVVYRVALRITGGDRELAQDASQDAFLKAFRNLDGFRGEAAFRTWLLSITANEARASLRKRARRRETSIEDASPVAAETLDPAEEAVLSDEVRRVRTHLQALPEKQRLAVSLRLEEGLGFREIGELIGSSEGAARVNYHYGIRKLREMLEDFRTNREST